MIFFVKCAENKIVHLPRQEVAFWEKARKIEGLESLEGDFYTRFKPEKMWIWAVTWLM